MASALTLTDGGIETSLIYQYGFDLPCFAAFPLLRDDRGRHALRRYFEPFIELASTGGLPFVLDTVTYRASPAWGAQLGYDLDDLARVNQEAVLFARELASGRSTVKISGMLGPRGDGYVVGERMTESQAAEYHGWQVRVLAAAGVDRITALTLPYPEEAIGVIRAANDVGIPVVVSFTVETDGRLPSGDELGASVVWVDHETEGSASFFMVNCAHPTHFAGALANGASWRTRIGGLRANASTLSHAELDQSDHLDEGDIAELASLHKDLRSYLPALQLLGGCCGTDHRHVAAFAEAWTGGL